MPICAVVGCNNRCYDKILTVSFYKLTKDDKLKYEWLAKLGRGEKNSKGNKNGMEARSDSCCLF